jgi:hypothetical protein
MEKRNKRQRTCKSEIKRIKKIVRSVADIAQWVQWLHGTALCGNRRHVIQQKFPDISSGSQTTRRQIPDNSNLCNRSRDYLKFGTTWRLDHRMDNRVIEVRLHSQNFFFYLQASRPPMGPFPHTKQLELQSDWSPPSISQRRKWVQWMVGIPILDPFPHFACFIPVQSPSFLQNSVQSTCR